MTEEIPKDTYVDLGEFCTNRIPDKLNCYKHFRRWCTIFGFYEPIPWWKFLGAGKLIAEIVNGLNTIDVYDQKWLQIFTDMAKEYENYTENKVEITINNHIFHPDPKK